MGQLTLEFDATTATEARARSIEERFHAFHRAHPDVFRLFRQFASEARESGRERFGAKAIFERIRWYCSIEQKGGSFQLNNVFTAHYARLLVESDPSFEGFFEFRELRAE